MTIFGKLFRPEMNTSSSVLGHLIAFAGFALTTVDGQAMLAQIVNPQYAWLIPLAAVYFGGAQAGQAPTPPAK